MAQVMEADVRQVCLSQYVLELPGDLCLVDVGADARCEDHTVFLPAIPSKEFLVFLPLMVRFQHCHGALSQLDLPATRLGLGWNKRTPVEAYRLELSLDPQDGFLPIHIRP